MAKTAYHHGDLRESLLVAAENALDEIALQDVSLREIARRAGVSHAAPKHHFASLGQLLGEVSARGYIRFMACLAEAVARDASFSAEAKLAAMARAYLRFAVDNSAVYGLMFGKREHVVETTPNLAVVMLQAWSQLEAQVVEMVGPARAQYAAVTVWATVHGLAMLLLERKLPPHVNANAAIESLIQTLLAGLRADT